MRRWLRSERGVSRSGTRRAARPQSTSSGEATHHRTQKQMATIWGVLLIAAGLVSLGASLVGRAGWPEAGISIGTGAMVAGFVLMLEPRLVRDVSEAAGTVATTTAEKKATEVATRIVDESTAEMRERIEQLEGIQELQERVEADRQAEVAELIRKVGVHPDFESTAQLLGAARGKDLFSALQLKTGVDTEILMNMTLVPWDWEDDAIRIELSSFGVEGRSAQAYWEIGQTIEQAWNACLDACEREAVPTSDIDLATAFGSLASSYGAMIEARRRDLDDPARLRGRLRILVNDEWAITDVGLESRITDFHLPWYPNETYSCPGDHDAALWEEALLWAPLWLDPDLDSQSDSGEPF